MDRLISRLQRTAIACVVVCGFAANAATAKVNVEFSGGRARTAAVATSGGPVVGLRRGDLDWYLGIPYAAPPVGPLRWRPPVAPPSWTAPRDATSFGDWCLQVAPEGFSKPILSENCLYLNVVAPHRSPASGKKRPVMVWLHGGGLRQGRSNDYDPTPLVSQGEVVFVSLNYRLNILGFMAHPALDKEGHAFANYGLMDQQFALRWVRDNIERFGGDPNNVTLIGESSGGANVFNHIAAPSSSALFHRAIVESGSLWFGSFAPFYDGLPLEEAEEVGRRVSAMTGCSSLEDASCLRSLTAQQLAEIVRKLPSYSFGVVVDGKFLDRTVTANVLDGDFTRIPILNGSNHDEWTWVEGLSERAAGHPLKETELEGHLAGTFGAFAAQVVPRYPVSSSGGSAGQASARAVTDGLFLCPMLGLNEALSKHTKVWGFEFNDVHAPFPFPAASVRYGAAHTLELQYIFKDYTGAVGELRPLSAAQKRLSSSMVRYWTNFARSGNPNSSNLPKWSALVNSRPSYLSLQAPDPRQIPAAEIHADHRCEPFWGRTVGAARSRAGY